MTPLLRRAVAELVGTAFLVMAVIGSGIMATRLTDDVGLQLLANSVATGAALVALILALQPVSASFNPVVTLVEAALGQAAGRRRPRPGRLRRWSGEWSAPMLANLMFGLPAVSISTTDRVGAHLWLAVVVERPSVLVIWSSLGVRFALRAGSRRSRPPVASAATSPPALLVHRARRTSFANPAVTLRARHAVADTFAGIGIPESAADVHAHAAGSAASARAAGLVRRSTVPPT